MMVAGIPSPLDTATGATILRPPPPMPVPTDRVPPGANQRRTVTPLSASVATNRRATVLAAAPRSAE